MSGAANCVGADSITLTEICPAEDVKELVSKNRDVEFCPPEIGKIVDDASSEDILQITKCIGSPVKITDVQKVDEKFFNEHFLTS